jgi:hypothetical protein
LVTVSSRTLTAEYDQKGRNGAPTNRNKES